jgi:ABC-type xylose transport system permease subunit
MPTITQALIVGALFGFACGLWYAYWLVYGRKP